MKSYTATRRDRPLMPILPSSTIRRGRSASVIEISARSLKIGASSRKRAAAPFPTGFARANR
jgi:hypothetical protein